MAGRQLGVVDYIIYGTIVYCLLGDFGVWYAGFRGHRPFLQGGGAWG